MYIGSMDLKEVHKQTRDKRSKPVSFPGTGRHPLFRLFVPIPFSLSDHCWHLFSGDDCACSLAATDLLYHMASFCLSLVGGGGVASALAVLVKQLGQLVLSLSVVVVLPAPHCRTDYQFQVLGLPSHGGLAS